MDPGSSQGSSSRPVPPPTETSSLTKTPQQAQQQPNPGGSKPPLTKKLFRLKNLRTLQDTEENNDDSQFKVQHISRITQFNLFNCYVLYRKSLAPATSCLLALDLASEPGCISSQGWWPRTRPDRLLFSHTSSPDSRHCSQVQKFCIKAMKAFLIFIAFLPRFLLC